MEKVERCFTATELRSYTATKRDTERHQHIDILTQNPDFKPLGRKGDY